jgi:hypothetical protein
VPELLARVLAKAIAWVESSDLEAVRIRAQARGWALREHGSRLGCFSPSNFPSET